MIKPTEQKLRSWTKRPQGETEQLLAAALEDAIVYNRVQTTSKVRRIHVGMALLTAAITVAAIGLIVARYDTPHTTSVPPPQLNQFRCYKMSTMPDDDTPPAELQPEPEVEPVPLTESEIQREIDGDETWTQKAWDAKKRINIPRGGDGVETP